MLKQNARFAVFSLYITDLITTVASLLIAYWVRSSILGQFDLNQLYPLKTYYWIFLAIIPVWSFLLFIFNAYKAYRSITFASEIIMLFKVVLTGTLILGSFVFITKSYYISRLLIFVFVLINLLLLILERFTFRSVSRLSRLRGYNTRNILIVGTNESARQIAGLLKQYQHWGFRILGFISESNESLSPMAGYNILGTLDLIDDVITHNVVDDVIFSSVPGKNYDHIEEAFLLLQERGIQARIVAHLFPNVKAKMHIEELESIPLLTFSTTPSNEVALFVKRLFDIIMSIIIILFTSPIMFLAMVLIKTTSQGPIFFKQLRCGLNGRIFTLYKFRSMYSDAENKKAELEALNEMHGPVFKIKNDPRVTKIGKFIRKTSIDELPQLWNVLRGEMSIVGPRPPLPAEVSQYKRWQRRRLSMRPGLTCLWQISGRNRIRDFDEWVKLDLLYIDTWSLMLDLIIMLKTIPVVLFSRGAE